MDGVWDRPPLGLGLTMALMALEYWSLEGTRARAPSLGLLGLCLWSREASSLAGQGKAGRGWAGQGWTLGLRSTRMRPGGKLLHVDRLSLSLSHKAGRAAKPGGFLHSLHRRW